MGFIEYIISAIAPHRCRGCKKEGLLLCRVCESQLPAMLPYCSHCGALKHKGSRTTCIPTPSIKEYRVATVYDGVPKELVHALKFGNARQAAIHIGDILAACLIDMSSSSSLVICHVPTATSRVRRRGYDQSALIAKRIAHRLKVPYRPLLHRQGQQRQLGKSRSIRGEQLDSAFWANKDLTKTEILLIDDVITTGATMRAAAQVLCRAGAERVVAAAFARA